MREINLMAIVVQKNTRATEFSLPNFVSSEAISTEKVKKPSNIRKTLLQIDKF